MAANLRGYPQGTTPKRMRWIRIKESVAPTLYVDFVVQNGIVGRALLWETPYLLQTNDFCPDQVHEIPYACQVFK